MHFIWPVNLCLAMNIDICVMSVPWFLGWLLKCLLITGCFNGLQWRWANQEGSSKPGDANVWLVNVSKTGTTIIKLTWNYLSSKPNRNPLICWILYHKLIPGFCSSWKRNMVNKLMNKQSRGQWRGMMLTLMWHLHNGNGVRVIKALFVDFSISKIFFSKRTC